MLNRTIFFVLFSTFILSCNQNNSVKRVDCNSSESKLLPPDDYNVSLVRLIATPHKYDGKIIQIVGFLNLEFEGNAIYLHEEDYKNKLTSNGFWVKLERDSISQTLIDSCNMKFVIMKGTFDMNSHGHSDLFSGAIKNITRIEARK